MIKPGMDYVRSGIVDGEIAGKLTKVVPASGPEMTKQLCTLFDSIRPFKKESSGEERGDVEGIVAYALNWPLENSSSSSSSSSSTCCCGGCCSCRGGQAWPPHHTPGELCAAGQASHTPPACSPPADMRP